MLKILLKLDYRRLREIESGVSISRSHSSFAVT
jgi:hypothetical protein